MKPIRWIPVALVAVAAAACTASAGAEVPPATSTSAVATSTPHFGLPTVVLPSPTATTAVSVPTSTPVAATATPRGVSTPRAANTPVSTASSGHSPTATPATASAPVEPGSYDPILNYQFTLPLGWAKSRTDEAITATDPSGKVLVSINETPVDRWRYAAVSMLGSTSQPEKPAGWTNWSLTSASSVKNGSAYEFQYTGTKNGDSYIQIVQWYFWGDLLVEVSTEAPADAWASNSKLRNETLLLLSGFVPHDGSRILPYEQMEASLKQRFDNKPSGIFIRDEVQKARIELSCREVFEKLLSEPAAQGEGIWQVNAQGDLGSQAWLIYEPSGTIVAVASNNSRC